MGHNSMTPIFFYKLQTNLLDIRYMLAIDRFFCIICYKANRGYPLYPKRRMESIMETVDVLIHVHPDLSAEARAKVEQDVQACKGVISACFSHQVHPHAVMVVYDSDSIHANQILEAARRSDPAATLVGL